jgi:hypothetical protein
LKAVVNAEVGQVKHLHEDRSGDEDPAAAGRAQKLNRHPADLQQGFAQKLFSRSQSYDLELQRQRCKFLQRHG